MHANEFAKRAAKIRRRGGRGAKFMRKAMAQLMREAGASAVTHKGQLIAWRMDNGQQVCVKRRFRTFEDAEQELARIWRQASDDYLPVRAYLCGRCKGFHLTSQQLATNDKR